MIVVAVLPPVLAGAMVVTSWLLTEPPQPFGLPLSERGKMQYFAAGPEFKLNREAAALRARKEAEERARQAFCPLAP